MIDDVDGSKGTSFELGPGDGERVEWVVLVEERLSESCLLWCNKLDNLNGAMLDVCRSRTRQEESRRVPELCDDASYCEGRANGSKLSEKTTDRLGYGFLAICEPATSMVVDTNVQGRWMEKCCRRRRWTTFDPHQELRKFV